MKHYYTLALILITLNTVGQAKKDNAVIIHGPVSFTQLKEKLFIEGWLPSSDDTTFILTNSKAIDTGGDLKLLIKRSDSLTIIKGQVSAQMLGTSTGAMPVEYTGMKGAAFKVSFRIMTKFAESFGLPVTFKRE